MNVFQRVALRGAQGLSKIAGGDNKFYEAFFKYLGGQYTQYDVNRETYLEKGFKMNPDVYSIITQKATKHSSVPFAVKRIKDEKIEKQIQSLRLSTKSVGTPENYIKLKALNNSAFEEEELPFPMEKPNPIQTWGQIIELYSMFMDLTGDFYLYMITPELGANAGKPLQVYVLPSHKMKIVLKPDMDMLGDENPIKSYMLIEGQIYTEFMAEDVIHIKTANPDYDLQGSHLYGVSRLRAVLRNIQSSNSTIDNNIKIMLNSGAFGFIHGKGNTPLTDVQAKSIRERLKEMDTDSSRMSRYAGNSTELGFTKISIDTKELMPFDFLKFDQKSICNALRWEVKLLNGESSGSSLGGRSEFELAEKRALTKAVIPDNCLLEEALNDEFIPRFPGYENAKFMFEYQELPEMQPDMKILTEWLNNALDRGVINRRMYLEALRFPVPQDPLLDIHTVASDILSLEESLDADFTIDNQNE